jgi:hypothetical protein
VPFLSVPRRRLTGGASLLNTPTLDNQSRPIENGITIRSTEPDLNTRMGYFIAEQLHEHNERQWRPRSLLRRLRNALTLIGNTGWTALASVTKRATSNLTTTRTFIPSPNRPDKELQINCCC